MLAIAGATILPSSCRKATRDPEPKDPEPTIDIEIEFNDANRNEVLDITRLQNYANDKTIRTIYLIPTLHWDAYNAKNITIMRNKYFQPRLDISPKIRGRGDFDFQIGEASKVPDDSLWFVKNGWTINKAYQK